jgi:putative ABC transport system substrate-binding protein
VNQGGTADTIRPWHIIYIAVAGIFYYPRAKGEREMKKGLWVLCMCVLALVLGACGARKDEGLRIGVIQLMDHPSLNEIREAFLEEMAVLGFGDADFDVRIGPGVDMTALTAIAQTFVGNDVDLIVSITTPATQAAANATADIPIIFGAVSDPVASGLVADLNRPDRNITGTSDNLPVESVFALARQLTPNARTFGLVYNLGEANSVAITDRVKEYLTANGYRYYEATVLGTADVQQAALSLVGRVDAFFTPTDNTVAAAMPVFAQVAIEAGLPIYTGADSMVADGGLATVGVNYTALGRDTARMAAAVLNGTPISQLPVSVVRDFTPTINRATAEALGIDVSGIVANFR